MLWTASHERARRRRGGSSAGCHFRDQQNSLESAGSAAPRYQRPAPRPLAGRRRGRGHVIGTLQACRQVRPAESGLPADVGRREAPAGAGGAQASSQRNFAASSGARPGAGACGLVEREGGPRSRPECWRGGRFGPRLNGDLCPEVQRHAQAVEPRPKVCRGRRHPHRCSLRRQWRLPRVGRVARLYHRAQTPSNMLNRFSPGLR
jgi:hypothetical protein